MEIVETTFSTNDDYRSALVRALLHNYQLKNFILPPEVIEDIKQITDPTDQKVAEEAYINATLDRGRLKGYEEVVSVLGVKWTLDQLLTLIGKNDSVKTAEICSAMRWHAANVRIEIPGSIYGAIEAEYFRWFGDGIKQRGILQQFVRGERVLFDLIEGEKVAKNLKGQSTYYPPRQDRFI